MSVPEPLTLPPRRFAAWQVAVVSLILAAALLNYLLPLLFPAQLRVLGVLDVGMEISLPSWFSTINLFVAGLLLAALYADARRARERDAGYWLLLTLVFFYMSLDESAHMHEKATRLALHLADAMSLLPASVAESEAWTSRGWILFGYIFVFVFGLICLPFLLRMRRALAVQFVIAGIVLVGGALVMETVGGLMLYYGWQTDDPLYRMRRIVEEGGEMFGVVIFNCALYAEMARRRIAFAAGG